MKGDPEQRALLLGEYIVEHGATVRAAARAFGCSKSTVHLCLIHVSERTRQEESSCDIPCLRKKNAYYTHLGAHENVLDPV